MFQFASKSKGFQLRRQRKSDLKIGSAVPSIIKNDETPDKGQGGLAHEYYVNPSTIRGSFEVAIIKLLIS